MNKAQEDRIRAKYADKMREKSARAKADQAAKRDSKSSIATSGVEDKPRS
jgi:hypothetical protein